MPLTIEQLKQYNEKMAAKGEEDDAPAPVLLIPSAANTSTVHSSSVVESGDLRRLHSEKHPNEHCPPPMADA